MSDLTTTYAAKFRDAIAQDSSVSVGPNVYVGLHDGDPGADGTANEIASAPGYSRAETAAPGDWDQYSDGEARGIENSVEMTWVPTGDWPTVTHVSLWDDTAANNGECIAEYALDRERSNIIDGDTPRFRAGQLRFELD